MSEETVESSYGNKTERHFVPQCQQHVCTSLLARFQQMLGFASRHSCLLSYYNLKTHFFLILFNSLMLYCVSVRCFPQAWVIVSFANKLVSYSIRQIVQLMEIDNHRRKLKGSETSLKHIIMNLLLANFKISSM